jgi:hypothetical protein
MAELLEVTKGLWVLELDRNGITDVGVHRLAEALERNSTLLPKGTGEQAVAQAAALTPRIDVKVDPVADASLEESLRAKVQSGELLGLAIVTADVLKPDPRDAEGNPATFALIVPTKSPPRLTGLLEKAVATSIVKARVKAAGTDYSSLNSLLSVPGTSVRRLAADGTEASESKTGKMESFAPWKAQTGVPLRAAAICETSRCTKPPQTGAMAAKRVAYRTSAAKPHVPIPPWLNPVR